MMTAVIGLIGAFLGGLISTVTEYYIAKQKINIEKLKMSKEDDLNTLSNFLVPVIEI